MTTQYLTGHNSSRYEDLLEPLREKRIDDMNELRKKLRLEAKGYKTGSPILEGIQRRYKDIEEAIIFWRSL